MIAMLVRLPPVLVQPAVVKYSPCTLWLAGTLINSGGDSPLAGVRRCPRLTPSGEWYCFEINPAPGFPFYESASGPIGEAIARLLSAA